MPMYDNQKFILVMRHTPKNWNKDIFEIPFIEKEDLPISEIGNNIFLLTQIIYLRMM